MYFVVDRKDLEDNMSLVERNIRSRKRKMSKIKGVRIKFYKVFYFEKYDYYYWNMWLKINK